MDRYQFEDQISDYIENTLSLSKRKEFEQYLEEHPEAQELVDSVTHLCQSMRSMKTVNTSDNFMEKLQHRVEFEKKRVPRTKTAERTIFGFTPLYASSTLVLLAALIFVGTEMIPTGTEQAVPGINTQLITQQSDPVSVPSTTVQMPEEAFVQVEEDSVIHDQEIKPDIDFQDRIQYVKSPR